VRIGYSESLAHRIEAGADFFLMPSRFEPCGLNQMYSQRYGTIPIVRSVGGLLDTVTDVSRGPGLATGYLFEPATVEALAETVELAKAQYRQTPELIAQMRRNGMRRRFGWEGPAVAYEDTYGWAVDKQKAWRSRPAVAV
jgi:starch synthase